MDWKWLDALPVETTNSSGTPKYFLSDWKCPKGTSCWEVFQIHFLLGRKYPTALPVWSASDCLSQICPKVSHLRPNNGYAAQADTAGHHMVQTTTNNTQIMMLHHQHKPCCIRVGYTPQKYVGSYLSFQKTNNTLRKQITHWKNK